MQHNLSDNMKVLSDHIILTLFSFGSIGVVGWVNMMMLLNGHDKIHEIRDLTSKWRANMQKCMFSTP
jgi:hypothetical protein